MTRAFHISLFFLAFAVGIAYWHGALEAAFAARWIIMAVGAPLLLCVFADPRRLSPLEGFGLLGLAAVVSTVFYAPNMLDGAEEIEHLLILSMCFCLGAAATRLESAWLGLSTAVTLSAAVAVAQKFYGFTYIVQSAAPAGLFVNKNIMAEAAAVCLVPLLLRRQWLFCIGPVIALALGTSRAACGAAFVVLALWAWRRHRHAIWLPIFVMTIVGLSSTIIKHDASMMQRFVFWHDALTNLTVFGHGLSSFTTTYPYAEFAHNELVQAVYELGIFALIPIAFVIYLLRGEAVHEPEEGVIVAILSICAFSFPLHMPVTAFAASLAAGRLARVRFVVRSLRRDRAAADSAGDSAAGAIRASVTLGNRRSGGKAPRVPPRPHAGQGFA